METVTNLNVKKHYIQHTLKNFEMIINKKKIGFFRKKSKKKSYLNKKNLIF